ncbi:MAG TPA: methyltransferase domain-containing protein [Nitrososphaera sp.]|nr:methyltransferase domain-containing protein [Nitrososphaera sp.]
MTLQDRVISILKKSPADQYSLYRQAGASMSEITKTIAGLQQKKIIHVAKYRKSKRTGLDIPVYSLSTASRDRLDVHGLLAGVTSERLVEYDFLSRNLVSPLKNAKILDVGSAGSALVQTIREFGKRWEAFGIDLEGGDAIMDARSAGFRDGVFDQAICTSTIEHVGLACDIDDKNGDAKAMREIFRVLKKGGSAIVTVPYGRGEKPDHRIYDKRTLGRLAGGFSVAKQEFYRYDAGKWTKCSQEAAGRADSQVPLHFHGAACACMLLRKQ